MASLDMVNLPSPLQSPVSTSRRQLVGALVGSVGLLALTGSPAAHASPIAHINEAINRAGRQRMLSQRMAKAWLALGQRVAPRKAQSILLASIDLFDRQLDELKAFAPTPQILGTYAALDPVWQSYRKALLQGPPDRARSEDIQSLDAKVLKLSHQGTLQLEAHSGRSTGKLVNVSGRQRMLSQRAAKLYLSAAWGTASSEQLTDLRLVRREFARALSALQDAKETTPAILEVLEMAQQQWVFFDNALARAGQPDTPPQHAQEVFSSSENILQIMDKATAMFSRLA